MGRPHYEQLARLFDYPDVSCVSSFEQVLDSLVDTYPEAAAQVRLFLDGVRTQTITQLQELFTRTFDVQAVTTLDVGYLLFGDDYKRGALLANLNREHHRVGNDCGTELADHLPNLLRLLARLDDEELVHDLVYKILGPALGKMLRDFDPRRSREKRDYYRTQFRTLIEVVESQAALYGRTIEALALVLRADFDISMGDEDELERSDGFLESIRREVQLEDERAAGAQQLRVGETR